MYTKGQTITLLFATDRTGYARPSETATINTVRSTGKLKVTNEFGTGYTINVDAFLALGHRIEVR